MIKINKKNLLKVTLFFLLICIFFFKTHSALAGDIYTIDAFGPGDGTTIMRKIDIATLATLETTVISVESGESLSDSGASNGVSVDPTSGTVYIIVRLDGFSSRHLATLNMETEVATLVGDLGDKFASIAFDKNGNLYGLTGGGADVPSALYSINKSTATKNLLTSYTNTADSGEALTYNFDNDLFYRLTGDNLYSFNINNPSNLTTITENDSSIGDSYAMTLFYGGSNNFYLIYWGSVYSFDSTTPGSGTSLGSLDEETKCFFEWPIVSPPVDTEYYPEDEGFNVSIDSNLTIMFNKNVYAGVGNLEIKKISDDSLIETIDITSAQVTGWGTDTITINPTNNLPKSTSMYINIDSGAIKDVDGSEYVGISDNSTWNFSTTSGDGNFSFEDNFNSSDFIDSGNTTAEIDTVNGLVTYNRESSWMKMDKESQGYENISNNVSSASRVPDIVFNSGHVFITWQDDALSHSDEIFFREWDGSAWSSTQVVSNGGGSSRNPKIVLDNSGKPIITWERCSYNTNNDCEILLSRWNGSAWTQMDGVTPGYENVSNDLPQNSHNPNLIVDNLGNPIVVWYEGNSDIFISRWNGSAWTQIDGTTPGHENVSNTSTRYSFFPDLVLDNLGNPVVIWHEILAFTQYDILLSRWNGSAWTQMDGVTPGYENVSNSSGQSYFANIILDNSGEPIISWHDDALGNNDIFISRWNGSAWTQMDGVTPGYENVSNNSYDNLRPKIIIDSSGRPIVTWYDDISLGYQAIFISRWNGSVWTQMDGVTPGYENVYDNSEQSLYPAIGIDDEDSPIIIWQNNTEILISRSFYGFLESKIISSTKLNGLLEEKILRATLDAEDSTPGESRIEYFLSNDGGSTWTEVEKGEELIFEEGGTDLRWKAILYAGSSPILDSISINYSTEQEDESLSKPTKLHAKTKSNTEIKLTWNDNSNNEDGFKIERKKKDSRNYKVIRTNLANDNDYTDDELEPDTKYTYRVRAYKDSSYSNYSNTDSAKTNPSEIKIKSIQGDCNSLTLKVSIDDRYEDEKVNFKVKFKNILTEAEDEIKFKDIKPNKKGESILILEPLKRNSTFEVKAKFKYDDDYSDWSSKKEGITSGCIVAAAPVEETTTTTLETEEKPAEKTTPSKKPIKEEPIVPIPLSSNETIIQKAGNYTKENQPQTAAAAIATLSLSIVAFLSQLNTLADSKLLFRSLFALFSGLSTKKRRDWGTVFDSKTGKPIPLATVSIYNKDKRRVDVRLTDSLGAYSFLVSPGEYYLKVNKDGYESDYQSAKVNAFYSDQYDGGTLNIQQHDIVKKDIPMMPDKKTYDVTLQTFQIKHFLFQAFFITGFIFNFGVLLFYQSIWNYSICLLYLVALIFSLSVFKRTSWGNIIDKKGHPVTFATIKVIDKDTETLKARTITDEKGRYYMILNPGNYNLNITGVAGRKYESNLILEKREAVKMEIVMG